MHAALGPHCEERQRINVRKLVMFNLKGGNGKWRVVLLTNMLKGSSSKQRRRFVYGCSPELWIFLPLEPWQSPGYTFWKCCKAFLDLYTLQIFQCTFIVTASAKAFGYLEGQWSLHRGLSTQLSLVIPSPPCHQKIFAPPFEVIVLC